MASNCLPFLFLLSLFISVSATHLHHTMNVDIGNPRLGTRSGVHFSISKDDETQQFYSNIDMGTFPTGDNNVLTTSRNVIVDLGGSLTWFDCGGYNSTTYRPIRCGTAACRAAKSKCGKTTTTTTACPVFPRIPQRKSRGPQPLGEDVMYVYATEGHIVSDGTYEVPRFAFSCSAGPLLLQGLPGEVRGVMGLGRTSLTALPTQLMTEFKLRRKFAICFPSSSSIRGNIIINGNMYIAPPYGDATELLKTTALLDGRNHGSSADEYFIDVRSIQIDGKPISIDSKFHTATKLSTAIPYTTLHTSIYKALISDFVKRASAMKISKVGNTPPFGACFNSKTVAKSMTGPAVPNIDLVMREGSKWRIYGNNSMVAVNKDVMCLGFVNGGWNSKNWIVLGGHQFGDNLLEFDLESNKLGFTSSLLIHNTSCSPLGLF